MKTSTLATVGGLEWSLAPGGIIGSLLLWAGLSSLAFGILDVPLGPALASGLTAVLAHWIGDIVHQLGHAWAARRTGYPMAGVRLGTPLGVLSTSLYPPGEPALPAGVHIQRALGGPLASLCLSGLAALVVLAWARLPLMYAWVAVFFLLDNFLLFTLGALLPLGFTDGSTLLRWWRRR